MKFKEPVIGAPIILIEQYNALVDRQDLRWALSRKRAVLKALTTNPEMTKVWKMLYKKAPSKMTMEIGLVHAVTMAMSTSEDKITTMNDDISKYQEIAKAARELVKKLNRSKLDLSPLHWFPDTAIGAILEKDINPDKANGYFCLINDEGNLHKKGGIYEEVINNDGTSQYWRAHENTREFFNQHAITPQYPVLSEILTSLAATADSVANQEAIKPRLANRTSASKTTVFIRALSPYWLETFNGPLYRTFATLSRVVLDDTSIDSNTVKDALKGMGLSSLKNSP